MESAIRDHPNIPVQQLKNTILRKCKVGVSKQKVQRTKREALEKIREADSVHYEKLWDYCEMMRKFNPGSKLIPKKLEGSDPPIFDRMYVFLWALKNGVLSGCRPIIGLDGCFLKTCYGGQMLVDVGRDGNDNMFPIAIAVVHGISLEEIPIEGSQISPASQEHELQSEATRGTKVQQTSVRSSAATHPSSTPPSSNVQTSVGSSATKHPTSTHPST
ncbi:UNVERIFIED_CONTAM: hypothetical protein Slati_2512000 [Sesamum latifolium]|uniref:Transposase n=1 Tax=Sesamum latifolium TaxID=2727402 RepID=A0AAW2WER6_9LAMI